MVSTRDIIDFANETHLSASVTDIVERAKSGGEIREKTKADYDRTFRRLVNLDDYERADEALSSVTRQSFYHDRAALLYGAAAAYKEQRKAVDVARKSGDLEAAMLAARRARSAVNAYVAAKEAKPPEERSAPRKSKRKSLPRHEQWREQVVQAASNPARDAVAVLRATGARPAEIEAGITLRHSMKNGEQVVVAMINGAKTDAEGEKGLGRRVVMFDPDSTAGRTLLDVIERKGNGVTVTRRARRIAKDFADIREKTGLKTVSAYSLRHAVAGDLKADGLDPVSIARTLGHISTRSQSRYGSSQQSSGGSGVRADLGRADRQPRSVPHPAPAAASNDPSPD